MLAMPITTLQIVNYSLQKATYSGYAVTTSQIGENTYTLLYNI